MKFTDIYVIPKVIKSNDIIILWELNSVSVKLCWQSASSWKLLKKYWSLGPPVLLKKENNTKLRVSNIGLQATREEKCGNKFDLLCWIW